MTKRSTAREQPGGDPRGGARSLADGVPPTYPWAYRLAFWFMRLLFDRYLTTHIIDRDKLPPTGNGAIIAFSHGSALDYVAGHAYGKPGFVALKREAAFGPLRWIGGIPIKRDEQDMVALRSMRAVLAAGFMLGIAPEGTRSRDGRLLPFDPGFVWLALKAGVPVFPCAIHGTHLLLPPGRIIPRRGTIWIKFGDPMRWPDAGPRPSREAMQAMADATREKVLALLADLEAISGIENPALAWERAAGGANAPVPRP